MTEENGYDKADDNARKQTSDRCRRRTEKGFSERLAFGPQYLTDLGWRWQHNWMNVTNHYDRLPGRQEDYRRG